MKESQNIALLVLILGVFTILGGTAFNGWFGDLPSYLGIDGFFTKFAIFGESYEIKCWSNELLEWLFF